MPIRLFSRDRALASKLVIGVGRADGVGPPPSEPDVRISRLAGLAFVYLYGMNVPFQDEFDAIVPVLTGNQFLARNRGFLGDKASVSR
jgi:hypothetical protein